MRLLLDSHVLLWFCEGNQSLSACARAAIEDPANEIWVSHVSAWEIAVKISLGKLKLTIAYEQFFPGAVTSNGFKELLPDFSHYRELLLLPFHHRDPFDRLLIAQARAESLTIITADPQFAVYKVPIVW
jgi:PIN domain nuclease of toxin-antitoxin system